MDITGGLASATLVSGRRSAEAFSVSSSSCSFS
jgi:hypothetical protein